MEVFDHHSKLLDEAIKARSPVFGELEDYLKLSGQSECTPVEAFDIFIKRWVDPRWWPHLMDSDDNDAEFVRRHIYNHIDRRDDDDPEDRD